MTLSSARLLSVVWLPEGLIKAITLGKQKSFGDICNCVEKHRRAPEAAENGKSNRNDLWELLVSALEDVSWWFCLGGEGQTSKGRLVSVFQLCGIDSAARL